ncbi:hypothetical protein VO64_4009 [Pseudomonas synxantha]|uniref:Uncharacterized protein n=1 Tax=Pseudomonas synxantha TaxID=47883 RepID=A0AAU8TQB3_9PSED|nr:hypothetical protein VO64_4009 [Pseudomonas synxantha]
MFGERDFFVHAVAVFADDLLLIRHTSCSKRDTLRFWLLLGSMALE